MVSASPDSLLEMQIHGPQTHSTGNPEGGAQESEFQVREGLPLPCEMGNRWPLSVSLHT